MKRVVLSFIILLLVYVLNGCGIKPQEDFFVSPIAIDDVQKVDEKAGSVTYEDEDILVKVNAVDVVDLLAVTSRPHFNPYIYISDWGKARQRYTVFDVTVKNKQDSDLTLQPAGAVLMDDQGEQYEAITSEEMRDRYSFPQRVEREVVYSPPRFYRPSWYYRHSYRYAIRPWYYHYDLYWWDRPSYVREVYDVGYLRRAIFRGTMLDKVKLYPGGKRAGFLVFPMPDPDAVEIKIILPAFITYKDQEMGSQEKRLEFQFKRVPTAKE